MSAYFWFQGQAVRDLYDQLGAADPDTAILKVTKDEGGDNMYLTVQPEGAGENTPINNSHRCPPSCP